MAQQSLPSIAKPKTITYDNLLGVDFRADQTEVDRRRSPNMVNMISDLGGNPIKRYGYRRVADAYAGIVTANAKTYAVRDSLTGIVVVSISIDGTTGDIEESLSDKIIISGFTFGNIYEAFGYQQYVFVLCEFGFVKVDVALKSYEVTGLGAGMMSKSNIGSSAPVCASIVPVSIIGLQPDGTGTDSVVLYGKNLLSIYQEYRYAGDGTSTEFKIPYYSKIGAWAKVEVMDANGNWIEQTSGTDFTLTGTTTETGVTLNGESTATFDVADAKITFTTAPSAPSTVISGEDNIKITVAPFNMADEMEIGGVTAKKGYYNETYAKLLGSKAHFFYESRFFVGVSEKTYFSEVNSPFIILDNSWFDVDSEVVAYQRMSSNLIVITKDTGKNSIFLANEITGTTTASANGVTQFSVKASNSGVGAITGKVGGILNDEPIFLSRTGIYGMLTNWSSEKYAVNRSGRVNRKMCKEENLEGAVGCAFDGYYYLAVNGRMYILDSRHKDSTRSGETSYECYYFEDMPHVEHMYVAGERMFFTDDLNTYTWNDDMIPKYQYYDNLVLDENGDFVSGNPVKACWWSRFDDDNIPHYLKTLKKKGCMVVLVPSSHTGCYVTLAKDGDEFAELGFKSGAVFAFDEVNFEPNYITFNGNDVVVDRFTKKKVKKYKRLQFRVGNDNAEPFSIIQAVKTYDVGNYAKSKG